MSTVFGRLLQRLSSRAPALVAARLNVVATGGLRRTMATLRSTKSAAAAEIPAAIKAASKAAKPLATTTRKAKVDSTKTAAAKKKPASAKKPVAKKKPAVKKAAPKRKAAVSRKKVRTAEEIEAARERVSAKKVFAKRQEMRKQALNPPPNPARITGYNLFLGPRLSLAASTDGVGREKLRSQGAAIAKEWTELPEHEKAKFNDAAKEKLGALTAAYRAFVESLTFDEVKRANTARRWLMKRGVVGYNNMIEDHRVPKRPKHAYIFFFSKNIAKFEGETQPERAKKCGIAWKALSEEERKPYEEMAKIAKVEYEQAKNDMVTLHPSAA